MFGNLLPALWRQSLGSRLSALPSHLRCRFIFPIFNSIRHLPGHNIDHELAELDGIAGAGSALHCHAPNMAWRRARRTGRRG